MTKIINVKRIVIRKFLGNRSEIINFLEIFLPKFEIKLEKVVAKIKFCKMFKTNQYLIVTY